MLERVIREAFARTPYPGDAFLQGSFEGCEPGESIQPFVGVRDWSTLSPDVLDAQYTALSFFSAGAFRFFLPAFLIADLGGALQTADPVFHLTGGFHEIAVDVPMGSRMTTRRSGGGTPLNPRRYGATTHEDYARFRLSAFAREECAAIVEYLRVRRQRADTGADTAAIDAALDRFWHGRAQDAPTTAELERHVAEDLEYRRSLG
jgi:hypothetical protein